MAINDWLDVFNALGFSIGQWAFIEAAIIVAYVVFGVAGFGTALVAAPVLLMFMPLSRIVPLLVLLDFTAAFGNWFPTRQAMARQELLRLLPCMVVGCSLGVMFLLSLKSDLLLLLMGIFITAYAIYSLAITRRPGSLSVYWVVPMGVTGGLFGALFGSGGFLYALYLNARLDSKEQIRATQGALISCSTLVRLSLFTLAGAYATRAVWVLAICLAPAMVLGLWGGRRLVSRLSREAFVRLVTWLVLISGISLMVRYITA